MVSMSSGIKTAGGTLMTSMSGGIETDLYNGGQHEWALHKLSSNPGCGHSGQE